jgi:hypothetical protein
MECLNSQFLEESTFQALTCDFVQQVCGLKQSNMKMTHMIAKQRENLVYPFLWGMLPMALVM